MGNTISVQSTLAHPASTSGARNPSTRSCVVEVIGVSRSFGEAAALKDVSLNIGPGEIHALLGPNGAGKTTLLRILMGLLDPDAGVVRLLGVRPGSAARTLRSVIGFVPSGDRTFYLRLSGLENLAFFARLHGYGRTEALQRARRALNEVGLSDAAGARVGVYSHGMQKRLSIARALLSDPKVLLVDEATHDLDPEGARLARQLVSEAAAERAAAVVWTTQRLDEIRGFANEVTVLRQGEIRFAGSVVELMAVAGRQRYVLSLRNADVSGQVVPAVVAQVLDGRGSIEPLDASRAEHYLLSLADGVVLGDAIAALTLAGVQVLACREERSEIEEAFLTLTGGPPAPDSAGNGYVAEQRVVDQQRTPRE